jgi:hypothetical protein
MCAWGLPSFSNILYSVLLQENVELWLDPSERHDIIYRYLLCHLWDM